MNTTYKTFSGFCPTQNIQNSITVDYLESTTLEDMYSHYIKGRFSCDYAKLDGRCPIAEKCPVYQSAPENI